MRPPFRDSGSGPVRRMLGAAVFFGFGLAVPATAQEAGSDRPIGTCRIMVPPGFERGVYQTNLWPCGIVPYEFDANVNGQNRQRAIFAMAEIEYLAGVNVDFIARTDQPDYVHILDDPTGNWSYVGRIGGRQDLGIYDWSYRFIIVHELLHALGLWHEQQRNDRDAYVQINVENIDGALCDEDCVATNFGIQPDTFDSGTYDFDSVMHYDQCAFSNCTFCPGPIPGLCRTITVLPPNQAWQDLIGQLDHLSTGDGNALRYLYGQWMVINLHPAGLAESSASGVQGGQQVGSATGGYRRASLWTGSAASWVDLHPAMPEFSIAYGVYGGQQVGFLFDGRTHASLWTGSAASWVDLNPGAQYWSEAHGVYGGQQVGYARAGGTAPHHAGLWTGSAGSWVDLNPAGAIWSYAYGVYGGQQVGQANVGGVGLASLWTGLAGSWVDLNPAGATSSVAYAVQAGQQVGAATVGGVQHAGLWTGTAASWVDLHPAGATESWARGVYGGQQVGAAKVGGVWRARLWVGSAASWLDLHAFLPAGFTISYAVGIWDNGTCTYVVGSGYNATAGRYEALMWTGGGLLCPLPGDMNGDGAVNGLDIQPFTTCLIEGPGVVNWRCGDLTGDGFVWMDDIPPFVSLLIGS